MKRILLTTAFTALVATGAFAQTTNCNTHEAVDTRLKELGEVVTDIKIISDQKVIVEYANSETTAWSIVLVEANGPACIISFGAGYEHFEPAPKDEKL